MWLKGQSLEPPVSYLDSRTSLDRNIFHQFSSITHSMQTHTVCSTLASSAAITLHREDKGHRAQPWSLPPVCENVTLHACKRCLARGQDPFTWFVEGERLNETGGRVRGGGRAVKAARERRRRRRRARAEFAPFIVLQSMHTMPLQCARVHRCARCVHRGAVALKAIGAVARSAPSPLIDVKVPIYSTFSRISFVSFRSRRF